jgi:hypothetical protein
MILPAMRRLIPITAAAVLLGGCAGHDAVSRSAAPVADQRPDALQPRRVGPAAMEAWIAPWESGEGDLYPEATVYISVAPERWEYAPADGPTVLRPVQLEARMNDAMAPPAAAGESAPFAPLPELTPAIPTPDGHRRETRFRAEPTPADARYT